MKEDKYGEIARAKEKCERDELEEEIAKELQEYLELQGHQKDIGLRIALLKSTLDARVAQEMHAKTKENAQEAFTASAPGKSALRMRSETCRGTDQRSYSDTVQKATFDIRGHSIMRRRSKTPWGGDQSTSPDSDSTTESVTTTDSGSTTQSDGDESRRKAEKQEHQEN